MDKPEKIRALPVRKVQSAYLQIAEQLRDLILQGSLLPGEQLPSEAQMSANFGVSRNTTREALRVLSSQGLIQTSRGITGGTFVAVPDAGFVQANIENGLGLLSSGEQISESEILETRLALELPAARWAAERRTDGDLQRIRIAARSVERGTVLEERTDNSVDFHQAVMEAAGNRLMSVLAPPVWRVFAHCAKSKPGRPHIWHDIDCDHAEILHHIEERNPDGAENAMKMHLLRLQSDQ